MHALSQQGDWMQAGLWAEEASWVAAPGSTAQEWAQQRWQWAGAQSGPWSPLQCRAECEFRPSEIEEWLIWDGRTLENELGVLGGQSLALLHLLHVA